MIMLNWERNSDHRTWRRVKEFGSSEVFQIFVVGDNINRSSGTFKIMPPPLESLEDGQEFFIMSIVVKFRGGKSAGVESNGVDFSIGERNGENCGDSIVGRISFNRHRSIWDPVG